MDRVADQDALQRQSVLTGDLIASSVAGQNATDRAIRTLEKKAAEIGEWKFYDTRIGDTRFTRFRGDGWQVLLSEQRIDLRAALLLYASLAAEPGLPRTRVAIGRAEMESVPESDLSSAHGAAFSSSGRALSEMGKTEQLRIADENLTPLETTLLEFLDDRISDWSAEQAEAVMHVLPPNAPTQKAIASRLGITPQAFSSRLSGARWTTIRRLLAAWEATDLRGETTV